MHITIDNASQFRDQFHRMGRGDQFSYEALGLLFDYLEDLDPDYELDVIELCCEYSEDTPEEIAEKYGVDLEGCEDDDDEKAEAVADYLSNETSLVGETSSGTLVYAQF